MPVESAVPETVFVSTLDEPIARPVIEDLSVAVLEPGIPRDRIVLAFKPPEIRPHTEFAVA